VSLRTEVARALVERGFKTRLVARVAGVSRGVLRRQERPADPRSEKIRDLVKALAEENPRYGTPRITVLVRRTGDIVNHKRVERIWDEEGLQLPRRRPKKRRLGEPQVRPFLATRPNEVWCYDFLHAKTEYGVKLRFLSIIDEFTRELLTIRVEKTFDSKVVLETIEALVEARGASPTYVRSDNGSEFVAEAVRKWWLEHGTQPVFIEPGSPWQNGYIESFHDKLRSECLDRERFWSRAEAQVISEWFRRHYNTARPHSSIDYMTPVEKFATTTAVEY